MIKNYWLVAWRNLIKNKAHSFINIAGLSVGMTVAILIGLWIHDEYAFDAHNPGYHRIARVIQNITHNGSVSTWTTLPFPLADELRKHYGEDFTRVVMGTGSTDHILGVGEKRWNVKGGFYEPQMADLLDLKMLRGRSVDLQGSAAIFLSSSTASALFGESDPIGKTIRLENSFDARVAGVYANLPYSSAFRDLAFIGSWQLYYNNTSWIRTIEDPWRPNAFELYVQLADKATFAQASEKIRDAKLKMLNQRLATSKPKLFLFPMSRWHLYSEFKDGVNTGGRIQYIWLFGIIGVFVLLLACINFMNLSTARSERRAREVGIRKAIGSLRQQLIGQFFSESLLVTIFALVFSLVLVGISLPFFNDIADKRMAIPWGNSWFWLVAILFSTVTGLVAGSYPALYLSAFRPVQVLKGNFRVGRNASIPRKALVVLQFAVSVILIIGTIIVYLQVQYAKDRPAGYDRDGLISIPVSTKNIHAHFDAVQNELTTQGAILSMTEGDGSPVNTYSSTSGISWPGKDPNYFADLAFMNVSWDYGKTVRWEIADGRDFSRDFPTDTSSFILNEAAVRLMGLKHPVGTIITSEKIPYKIIGIVKDLVQGSPYEETRPMVFTLNTDPGSAVIARLSPGKSVAGSLAAIAAVFTKENPDQPFEYRFADDEYARRYENEQRIVQLAGVFAGLAIFISLLGLFGMSSYVAEQRTKEIGVRKVLGASVFNLWGLLSKEFLVLVCLALIIAIPLAWLGMHAWLKNYSYRASMTAWCFVMPAAGALLITLLTVSFTTVKAALTNPVRSLRTE